MAERTVDILVVSALGVETDAVRRHPSVKWVNAYDKTADLPYLVGTLKNGLSLALVQLPTMGPTSAAVTTTRAIEALRPKRVVLTGIAAGIGNDVALGDIVVSDQVVDYDQGKISSSVKGPVLRWRGYAVDPTLLSLAKERAESIQIQVPGQFKEKIQPHPEALKVHFGTILSGSKVVADGRVISELTATWTQAVGLEMEAGGGAAAAHNSPSRPTFIIIKGVSDKADSKKDDSYRSFSAYVAVDFVLGLLASLPSTLDAPALFEPPSPPEPWIPVDELGELSLSIADIKAMLRTCFNLAELQSLCGDIGLDWEDLADRDQKSKVIDQIVLTRHRHFKLRALVDRIRDLRPGAFR